MTLLQIVPQPDALMDAYHALATIQNIEDMQDYALAWSDLSDMARLEGRPALAAMCLSRAEYYSAQLPGEYVRLVAGSLAELVPV